MHEALLLPRTRTAGPGERGAPIRQDRRQRPPGEPDGASTEPASQSLSFVFLSSGTLFKLWPSLSPLPGSPDAQGPSGDAPREKEGQTPRVDTRTLGLSRGSSVLDKKNETLDGAASRTQF